MRHEDLPERWKRKVRGYLTAKGSTKYDKLCASDFSVSATVHIKFEDDSKVEFKHALVIEAPEFREIAVFTEHCGYHLFHNYDGLNIKIESASSEPNDTTLFELYREHLQGFMDSFIAKRYKKNRFNGFTDAKSIEDLIGGMDALYRELDERYCHVLPKGSKPQDVAFVLKSVAEYKLTTCCVFSADKNYNLGMMPIGEALNHVIGSLSATIVSFIPGKAAYFEGHSPGSRYLCIKKMPIY